MGDSATGITFYVSWDQWALLLDIVIRRTVECRKDVDIGTNYTWVIVRFLCFNVEVCIKGDSFILDVVTGASHKWEGV